MTDPTLMAFSHWLLYYVPHKSLPFPHWTRLVTDESLLLSTARWEHWRRTSAQQWRATHAVNAVDSQIFSRPLAKSIKRRRPAARPPRRRWPHPSSFSERVLPHYHDKRRSIDPGHGFVWTLRMYGAAIECTLNTALDCLLINQRPLNILQFAVDPAHLFSRSIEPRGKNPQIAVKETPDANNDSPDCQRTTEINRLLREKFIAFFRQNYTFRGNKSSRKANFDSSKSLLRLL